MKNAEDDGTIKFNFVSDSRGDRGERFTLLSFGKYMDFLGAEFEMLRLGYEPADSDEAWEFAGKNFEFIKRHNVIARRNRQLGNNGPSCIFYDPDTGGVVMRNVPAPDYIFSDNCRFLVKKVI